MSQNPERWLTHGSTLVATRESTNAERWTQWLRDAGSSVVVVPAEPTLRAFLLPDTAEFEVAVIGVQDEGDPTIQLAEQLHAQRPLCGQLWICGTTDPRLVERVRLLGAGYLAREPSATELIFSIRRVVEGTLPNLHALVAHARRRWLLSPQEARVLYYNLWSFSNDEIAQALHLSVYTVHEYQHHLRQKTGARTKSGYLRRILESSGCNPPPLPARCPEATASEVA